MLFLGQQLKYKLKALFLFNFVCLFICFNPYMCCFVFVSGTCGSRLSWKFKLSLSQNLVPLYLAVSLISNISPLLFNSCGFPELNPLDLQSRESVSFLYSTSAFAQAKIPWDGIFFSSSKTGQIITILWGWSFWGSSKFILLPPVAARLLCFTGTILPNLLTFKVLIELIHSVPCLSSCWIGSSSDKHCRTCILYGWKACVLGITGQFCKTPPIPWVFGKMISLVGYDLGWRWLFPMSSLRVFHLAKGCM